MGLTTVYDVRVNYAMHGGLAAGMQGAARATDNATRSAGLLRGALGGIATMAAGIGIAGVAMAGKRAFVDFNATIEQQTLSLATIIQMNLGGSFDAAGMRAKTMFTDYQNIAKASVGTTQDFVEMNNQIAASVFRAGMGMGELRDITKGAVIAATVLGERADIAALDIKQMLSGDVTTRDRVAQQLLASQGIDHKSFNKMKQGDRNAVVFKALNQPALQNAAKAMENSFSGVLSTLQDNLGILAGKIGLPLFRAISVEVQKWNSWIAQNPSKIADFAGKFSSALVTGLQYAKDAGMFIKDALVFLVDNKDLLLTITKAFLVFKGAKMAGGLAFGLGKTMADFGASLGGMNSSFGSLVGVLGGPGGVIALFAALTAVGFGVYEMWRKEKADLERDRNGTKAVLDQTSESFLYLKDLQKARAGMQGVLTDRRFGSPGEAQQSDAWKTLVMQMNVAKEGLEKFDETNLRWAKEKGFLTDDLRINREGLLRKQNEGMTPEGVARTLTVLDDIYARRGLLGAKDLLAEKQAEVDGADHRPIVEKPTVIIQKLEVRANDPNRFMVGLSKMARKSGRGRRSGPGGGLSGMGI